MICAVVSRVLGWLQWSPGRNSAARRRRLVARCEVAARNPFRAGRLPDVVRNGAQRQIDDAARLMFGAEACTRLPWNINTDPGLPVGATMPPSLTRPRHGLVRREPVKKIALEEHFTTPTLLRYSHEGGSIIAPDQMAFIAKAILDLDKARIEEMDRYGIDTSILSATTPGVQGVPDAQTAVRVAKETNDYLAAAVQRHPKRLMGFADLPMQAPKEAAGELERAVKQLGFKGALLNGATNGEYYDHEKFWPVWERAEALQVPIYLHPANAPETNAAMMGPRACGRIVGVDPGNGDSYFAPDSRGEYSNASQRRP